MMWKRMRYALSCCVAAAMLAGCGGSQPPIGAPGAMPQAAATATHADRGKSWMLSEAKSEDLLYVSAYVNHVYVYSYPKGKLVGRLHLSNKVESICSDEQGNIWVPVFNSTYYRSKVLKFAHGGKNPIASVDDGGALPAGCSVSPITGDLAVANYCKSSGGGTCDTTGDVAVYAQATGSPKTYISRHMGTNFSCDYDDKGNLFVVGTAHYGAFNLAELPFGKSQPKDITINQAGLYSPVFVQWDGKHVAIGSFGGSSPTIYAFAIKGANGTEVGSTTLGDTTYLEQFIFDGKNVIVPGSESGNVAVYKYPGGGSAVQSIGVANPLSVALSVAVGK